MSDSASGAQLRVFVQHRAQYAVQQAAQYRVDVSDLDFGEEETLELKRDHERRGDALEDVDPLGFVS